MARVRRIPVFISEELFTIGAAWLTEFYKRVGIAYEIIPDVNLFVQRQWQHRGDRRSNMDIEQHCMGRSQVKNASPMLGDRG